MKSNPIHISPTTRDVLIGVAAVGVVGAIFYALKSSSTTTTTTTTSTGGSAPTPITPVGGGGGGFGPGGKIQPGG